MCHPTRDTSADSPCAAGSWRAIRPTATSVRVVNEPATAQQAGDPVASETAGATTTRALGDGPDLDAIDRDLDGVEQALRRLADGSYWTDEVTGAAIPDDLLAADPTTRRVG